MNNIHGGICSVKRILQTRSRRVWVENSERMSSFATVTVSFFSKPNKTSWHLYGCRGVTRGAREAQCPGRRITTGSAEWVLGRLKVQTMSQVLSSIQYICFLKTSNSNMVAPNVLLARGAV